MRSTQQPARVIDPADLIGAATACGMLAIDRATMSRWIARGKLVPLTQLDGPKGAFIFDRNDVTAQAAA